jgi:signal transduction histidine kinase
MESRAAGPRGWFRTRSLSSWLLPEADRAPGVGGGSPAFEQSELVLMWQRLRILLLVVVVACSVVVTVVAGSFSLHDFGRGSIRSLLVIGLGLGLLADARFRIRRRNPKPLLVVFLDATAITVGLALLQVHVHALAAPFLYVGLTAAIVLPVRRAAWMWCYEGLLGALLVLTSPFDQWLGPPAPGTQLDAFVWVITGVFGSLCIAEALVLTAAVHRYAQTRNAQLADQMRRKDDFLAGVSHELRTPLAGVFGFASELRDGADRFTPAEVAEFAGLIARGCATANTLVEDLLVAARLETTDVGLNPQPTDLHSQAYGVCSEPESASQTEGKSVALEGQSAVAWADPNRVSQIIRNLVSNAGRYGGNRITIVTGVTAEPPKAFLRVVDDGPGVPESLYGVLFQAYQHGAQELGRTESVGLGLHVSRKLAQLMGGDLTYRRQHGTTIFELTLPLAPEAQVDALERLVAPVSGGRTDALAGLASSPPASSTASSRVGL